MYYVVISLSFIFSWVTAATAQSALDEFVGHWRSTGMISARLDAAPEPGRCRARAEKDEEDQSIFIQGRCAVAAGAGRMSLRFVDDGNGQVRGGFASPAIDSTVQMAGIYNSNSVQLSSRTPISADNALYDLRSEIVFQNANLFVLRDWIAPVGTNQWRLVNDQSFVRTKGNE